MKLSLDNLYANNSTSLGSTASRGSNKVVETRRGVAGAITQPDTPVDPQETQSARVTISEDALRKAGMLKDEKGQSETNSPAKANDKNSKESSASSNTQEARRLEALKSRDREVRAHEQAHISAGGTLVRGGASFGYATGPDGKLYAVTGEVSIDSSPVQDDPSATIRKMTQVTKAALAPAQPSGQDRAVASAATKAQMDAQAELTRQQVESMQSGSESDNSKKTAAADAQKSDQKSTGVASAQTADQKSASAGMPNARTSDSTSKSTSIFGVKDAYSNTLPTGKLPARDAGSNLLPTGKLPAKESDSSLLPSGKLPAKETDSSLLPSGKLPAKEAESKSGQINMFAIHNKIQSIKNQAGVQKQNAFQLSTVNIQA